MQFLYYDFQFPEEPSTILALKSSIHFVESYFMGITSGHSNVKITEGRDKGRHYHVMGKIKLPVFLRYIYFDVSSMFNPVGEPSGTSVCKLCIAGTYWTGSGRV